MSVPYKAPDVLDKLYAFHNEGARVFYIQKLNETDLHQAADLLAHVQIQLAQKGNGHLLKTRSPEDLIKYHTNGAVFIGVAEEDGLVGVSMVAPAKNYNDVGRINAPIMAAAFNGLSEDVVGLHNPENPNDIIDPTQIVVFGAMGINQCYANMNFAKAIWPYRLKAAIAMDLPYASTTISADNKGVIKHYLDNKWIQETTQLIEVENGKETILYRFVATKAILKKNLENAQTSQPAMAFNA